MLLQAGGHGIGLAAAANRERHINGSTYGTFSDGTTQWVLLWLVHYLLAISLSTASFNRQPTELTVPALTPLNESISQPNFWARVRWRFASGV